MPLYDYYCPECGHRMEDQLSAKMKIRCKCGTMMKREVGGRNVIITNKSTPGGKG